MKQQTLWRPDTCKCEIIYEWDDSEEEPVHTAKKVRSCDLHDGTKQEVYETVLDENQRKNKVLGIITDNLPDLTVTATNENGDEVTQLKKEHQYKWEFDDDRNLQVEVTGISKDDKAAIIELTDTEFDKGKVEVA